MVTDFFGVILQELGNVLQIPDLHPDKNNSCLIKFPSGLKIQIEVDPKTESLTLGCDLGEIPAGKYRENIFREALKANGMPRPQNGIFGFSQDTGHLVIFEALNSKDLRGGHVATALTPFIEKAQTWSEAIAKGDVPLVSNMYSTKRSTGMFGLR